jgi:hypothetical protein
MQITDNVSHSYPAYFSEEFIIHSGAMENVCFICNFNGMIRSATNAYFIENPAKEQK